MVVGRLPFKFNYPILRLSIYSLYRGKVSLLLTLILALAMNLKTILNGAVLFIGLGLAAYSQFDGQRLRFNIESVLKDTASHIAVEEEQKHKQVFEIYQLKPGSIYDGDTLRVQRNGEELKIRFCGTDSPEIKQPMGIEARDHLRLRSAHCPSGNRLPILTMANYGSYQLKKTDTGVL